MKVQAASVPSARSKENLSHISLLASGGSWQCLATLDSRQHNSNLCFCSHMAPSPVSMSPLFQFFIRTLVIGLVCTPQCSTTFFLMNYICKKNPKKQKTLFPIRPHSEVPGQHTFGGISFSALQGSLSQEFGIETWK